MITWQRSTAALVTGLLTGIVIAAPISQSTPANLLPEADLYLKAEMTRRSIPGLAAAVVRDGRIIAMTVLGFADLEHDVPVSLDTVFPIASLDKQLTASGILLLAQSGKLRLDDEIGGYFADPPASWKGIHITHLLSHTSGLPDVVDEEIGGRPFISYTTDGLLSNIKRQPLLFPPGTASEYSDAGLFLCQLITEKVSGMPWRRFVAERLFSPAGMASMVEMSPTPVIKNRVSGYELTTDGQFISNRRTAVDFGPLYNDVGANIVDFARWAVALETDKVMPRAMRDAMWTSQGHHNYVYGWRDYGFGWGLDRYRGVRVAIHSGHSGTGIVVLPEQHISVVVFTNLDNRFGADAHGIALGIAGFYFPGISLLGMAAESDPDPARTRQIQEEFVLLMDGRPTYGKYASALHRGIQEAITDFATRQPHLGTLNSLSFLEERDDEGVTYYRADFANARLFLRIGHDNAGKINCFQVIHV